MLTERGPDAALSGGGPKGAVASSGGTGPSGARLPSMNRTVMAQQSTAAGSGGRAEGLGIVVATGVADEQQASGCGENGRSMMECEGVQVIRDSEEWATMAEEGESFKVVSTEKLRSICNLISGFKKGLSDEELSKCSQSCLGCPDELASPVRKIGRRKADRRPW